jgi:hypothetical protein
MSDRGFRRCVITCSPRHRAKILIYLLSKIPLGDANNAVVKMEEGKARYRFVLVNESNGGKISVCGNEHEIVRGGRNRRGNGNNKYWQ